MVEVLLLCVDEADRLTTEGLGPGDPAKYYYTITSSLHHSFTAVHITYIEQGVLQE